MTAAPFQELPWPRIRELVVDALSVGHRTHMAHGMVEFDVSRPIELIARYRAQVPDGLSFTAFLVYCLGHAVDEHKMLHAFRKGRRKLVVFDDVDVNTLLEKRKPDGSLVPVIYVVRAANRKSLAQINHEMRAAARTDLYDDEGVRRRRQLLRLPRPARRAVWWWMRRDPARVKRQWGTVGLSNVGSFISPRPSWGISISFLTSTLIVGGMFDKVRWIDGAAAPRKTLSATVTVDHDIVDGAPGARFGETLAGLIENAAGLDDTFVTETLTLQGGEDSAAK
ncbi:2-oxo acid dehydrogenase subunit E2 [Solwaraspora sp. WMMD937]|uniref:2-oxo acid dehydrogenase subunit E2 n=1 Tax=Solwaraspora sp. WMMD937 TaxID=3016090 RepID=UPI00249C094E|nr:2-oxo acid dehydrogenase subunit E2 [Solwaraspora sp. WMMD937]WFE20914.1 2-oxo acid dehydrogenase subunit E2 [Solwaraspora sp. WMMD937]